MSPQHVIIVGAGLAGPALAIALSKQSIQSTILERRAVSEDIGGVIVLAANAMRVMDGVVGIGDRLRRVGQTFDDIQNFTEGSGTSGLKQVGGFVASNSGTRAVCVMRPTLHEMLLERCGESEGMIDLRYGAKVKDIEETKDGVTAFMEDGTKVKGDIMIGADGIGSIVRKHVLGDKDPPAEYSGVVSIGCMVSLKDANLPPNLTLPVFLHTRSGTFLVFAVDQTGDRIQWATSIKVPERERRDWKAYEPQAVSDVKAEWESFTTEPIRSLVDHLTVENVRLWAPYQIPQIPTWHSDRLCFIGDAAHAVPPSVGQGAAQAFEDIALLSRLLAHPPAVQAGYPKLFSHFETKRRVRTDMIRVMAARAEVSREKTDSAWVWMTRTWAIWLGIQLLDKARWVMGDRLNGYDITKESIDVV